MECRQERTVMEKRLGLVVNALSGIVNELASAETTGDAAVLDHNTVDDYTIINSQG
jgi:hypothetical protein